MEMSDNETTKITDDDGTTWYEAIDGKRYKTRSGAWKRTQKLKTQGEVTEEPLEMPNDQPVATEEDPTFDGPDWAPFDTQNGLSHGRLSHDKIRTRNIG